MGHISQAPRDLVYLVRAPELAEGIANGLFNGHGVGDVLRSGAVAADGYINPSAALACQKGQGKPKRQITRPLARPRSTNGAGAH